MALHVHQILSFLRKDTLTEKDVVLTQLREKRDEVRRMGERIS